VHAPRKLAHGRRDDPDHQRGPAPREGRASRESAVL